MKSVDAIIVARTGSTRVPGKALVDVCGTPILGHIVARVRACKNVGRVCLATTDLPADDAIQRLAESTKTEFYRGDPELVLNRVYGAVRQLGSENFVEIGGDCPFTDPGLLDEAIGHFGKIGCDYLFNYSPPTFPEGMDINVLSARALDRAFREAIAPSHRIHPFSYLSSHPEKFRIENYKYSSDLSSYHWSYDFPEDLEFIKAVYEKLYDQNPMFGMDAILSLIESDKSIRDLNEKLRRPPVKHAFWNSPGIIRDMNADIASLVQEAGKAIAKNDFEVANRCYQEIRLTSVELENFTRSKLE